MPAIIKSTVQVLEGLSALRNSKVFTFEGILKCIVRAPVGHCIPYTLRATREIWFSPCILVYSPPLLVLLVPTIVCKVDCKHTHVQMCLQ